MLGRTLLWFQKEGQQSAAGRQGPVYLPRLVIRSPSEDACTDSRLFVIVFHGQQAFQRAVHAGALKGTCDLLTARP